MGTRRLHLRRRRACITLDFADVPNSEKEFELHVRYTVFLQNSLVRKTAKVHENMLSPAKMTGR